MLLAVALALLAACSGGKKDKPAPAIGQAFVGPITLTLREEIHPRSKPVAQVEHGEKVDIIQVRRRFVRVRTARGQEGWTDSRQLLSVEQMKALEDLAAYARKLPSQGEATVYEPLNMHTEPSRPSTSFYQIHEGMKVDVVGHRLTPRSTEPPRQSLQIRKPAPPARARKPKREPKIPPPPKPPAPGLPSNWLELSKSPLPPEPEPEPEKKPKVPLEDWSLVRTKDGKAGWVLTRNLVMAIPDEVAQYSEGARITSYFALGDVQDGDQTKHHWLWTTLREPGKTYQFDSFRVFIYMLRRHRYETAYIERGVEGYYPVRVTPGAMPKFELILRDAEDGQLHRKTYVLEGYLVRKVGDTLYTPEKDTGEPKPAAGVPGSDASDEPEDGGEEQKPGLLDRLKSIFRR